MVLEEPQTILLKDGDTSGDTFTREAVNLLLFQERDISGFYHQLRYLEKKKWNLWKEEKLCKVLGLSRNTYFKYQKRLVSLGIIKITNPQSRHMTITFLEIHLPIELQGKVIIGSDFIIKALPKYIDKILKLNSPEYKEEIKKQKQLQEQQKMFDDQVEEKAKEIIKKKDKKKKQEEERFPIQNYRMVIDGYKKYKGLGLNGSELSRARGTIRKIFLAERTPKQIIDCMKRFSELKDEPEYIWLKHWTLETVMKKIPEFIAGDFNEKDSSSPLSFKEANAIMNQENDADPSLYEKD